MDFSSEAPEQKGKFLKNAGKVVKKVVVNGWPIAAEFGPALKPVAAVVAAVRQ